MMEDKKPQTQPDPSCESPKPVKPPKKTWRERLKDLGDGIGEALGEALFGGGR